MNWSLALGLTVVLCVMAFFRLRTDVQRVRMTNWFIVYPGTALILLYAWFYSKWAEVLTSAVATTLIVGGWWFAYGRGLPAPTSDNIKVWGQEAKRPSQVAAEAQAEVERLKKEKEQLEQELAELKAKNNGRTTTPGNNRDSLDSQERADN